MGKGYIARRGSSSLKNNKQTINYTFVYHEGLEDTDVTGGLIPYTKETMRQYATFRTSNMVDLTGYRKAVFVAKATGTEPVVGVYITVADALVSSVQPDKFCYVEDTKKTMTYGDINASGRYYLNIGADWSSGSNNTLVTTKEEDHLTISMKDAYDTRGGDVYTFALFKADDWQTWISLANLSGFETLEKVFANTSAINLLLANEEACKFMVAHCTGEVMASAITSATFMTALKNSAYK